MNKVIMMGRLTRNVEIRYSNNANNTAVAKYAIAVRKDFARQGEPDCDFFNITAFGKAAEFVNAYFQKGDMIVVCGRVVVDSWNDNAGAKHTSYNIVVENQYFCGGSKQDNKTFTPANMEEDEEELPF